MQDDEKIHIPGLGEQETLPGGGITAGDAVPEMPPGSDMEDVGRKDVGRKDVGGKDAGGKDAGGDLDAADMAQPTSAADTTGDRATGLTGLRGG